MKELWQSYKSLLSKRQKIAIKDNISITNDPIRFLENKLEFFLPEFLKKNSIFEYLNYIMLWTILLNILTIKNVPNLTGFFVSLTKDFMVISITMLSGFSILDSYRTYLKSMSIWHVCIRVILLFALLSVVATFIVSVIFLIGEGELTKADLAYDTMLNSLNAMVITLVLLMYYLHRYIEFLAIQDSFELRLAAQNELFKARMSPHFFFNTINGLTALVESNPEKAVVMLANISTLFRASFDNTTEISMDQEVELCQVFLQIDEMRFHGKLNVSWDLPDEDLMYDMVITNLTLQTILEKLLHHVVELTTENIGVNIAIKWEHHQVDINISIDLPTRTLLVHHDLKEQINFSIQQQRLKQYFGEESKISNKIEKNKIQVLIQYPLHDPGLSAILHTESELGDTDL